MHKDKEGHDLKEGFYRKHDLFGLPVYFLGKYDSSGNAIAEGHKGILPHDSLETSEWLPVDNIRGYLRVYDKFREDIGRNINWVTEKISSLEKFAQEADQSAQDSAEDDDVPF